MHQFFCVPLFPSYYSELRIAKTQQRRRIYLWLLCSIAGKPYPIKYNTTHAQQSSKNLLCFCLSLYSIAHCTRPRFRTQCFMHWPRRVMVFLNGASLSVRQSERESHIVDGTTANETRQMRQNYGEVLKRLSNKESRRSSFLHTSELKQYCGSFAKAFELLLFWCCVCVFSNCLMTVYAIFENYSRCGSIAQAANAHIYWCLCWIVDYADDGLHFLTILLIRLTFCILGIVR